MPPKGEVTRLGAGQRRKLEGLASVLSAHRRDGVYEVKVIDVPQAWLGLAGRAVLLISLPALRLLDAKELQALVAHEAGHEYFWAEFAAAQRRRGAQSRRKVETACDAIAVLTLELLGIKTERLIAGIEKVYWFNLHRLGIAMNYENYPSLKDRRKFIEQFSAAK